MTGPHSRGFDIRHRWPRIAGRRIHDLGTTPRGRSRLDGYVKYGQRPQICRPALLAFALCGAVLVTVACSRSKSFFVTIVDPLRRPIAGAVLEGGVDWDKFRDTTDTAGIAILPYYAANWWTAISATNFLPLRVDRLRAGTYVLTPTEDRLRRIGAAEGYMLRMSADTLLTLTYQGVYRAYTLDSSGLTEVATSQLATTTGFKHVMRGDTLWFGAHDDGVYAYSLSDPTRPALLWHFPIPGYVRTFEVNDSATFVLIDDGDEDSVWLFACWPTGDYEGIAQLGPGWVSDMVAISHYLVLVGYSPHLAQVYDVQSPRHPRYVTEFAGTEYSSGFPFHDTLVLTPKDDYPNPTFRYGLLDLHDPANPVESGLLYSDVPRLSMVVDESTAVGWHNVAGLAILRGSLSSGLHTTAVVAMPTHEDIDIGGFTAPYYLLSGFLWKLEHREHQ
jgi:hypothetical protein